jgi:hypothetical protein
LPVTLRQVCNAPHKQRQKRCVKVVERLRLRAAWRSSCSCRLHSRIVRTCLTI